MGLVLALRDAVLLCLLPAHPASSNFVAIISRWLRQSVCLGVI
jgi:hypothetical protein